MQNKDDNKLDQILRDKLRDLETFPGAHNWEMIESQLGNDESRPMMKYRIAGIAALMLISFGALGLLFALGSMNGKSQQLASDQNLYLDKYAEFIYNQAPQTIVREVPVVKETVQYVAAPQPTVSPVESAMDQILIDALLAQINDLKTSIEDIRQESAANNASQQMLAALNEIRNDNRQNNEADMRDRIIAEVLTAANVDQPEDLANIDEATLVDILSALRGKSSERFNSDIINKLPNTTTILNAFDGRMPQLQKAGLSNREMVDNILQQNFTDVRGLHVGATAAVNNTWILNNNSNTSNDLKNVGYVMDYGTHSGVRLGYDFGKKYGVEVNYLLNAHHNQKFSYIVDQQLKESRVSLKYIHVPVLFKYKWQQMSPLTRKPMVLNYVFGLQYSRLQSLNSNVDENIVPLSSLNHVNDLGIVVGLDYDMHLTNHYFFSFGARSTYSSDAQALAGLLNGGTSDKTNNFTVGLTGALNYRF